jgi:hypothetical protein
VLILVLLLLLAADVTQSQHCTGCAGLLCAAADAACTAS